MMERDCLEFKDYKTTPDPFHSYTVNIKQNNVPLIIDNGSYNCRVGWATSDKPLLIFKNVLAKPRRERGKKDGEIQIGNDVSNIDAGRYQLKTQFDRNIVSHMEIQEHIFNYVFSHLGINTEGCINHPVIITEAFLNPNYSRLTMSELLYECYGVPSICYCVDSLLSYKRDGTFGTGLVISCGYHATHVIPIIDGNVDAKNARRIDVGGFHITYYLHRLLQLKYPVHLTSITLSRAEELLHEHCHVAFDYAEEIRNWADGDYYDKNVKCFQLPYSSAQSILTLEQQKERRKELARRLIEINARKREEKLAEDEEQLNQLLAIQDLRDEGEESEFQNALADFGLNSGDELPKMITQVQARIERIKQKIVAANTSEDPISEEPKQKILKFQTPKAEEDFKTWVEGVKRKREELLEKRAVRRQRRSDMAKRRTLASVERMRLISQLARNEKTDDDFGLRDEDWDVYKAINKEGGDTDSEGETEKLLELEQVLKAHDPTWNENGNSGESPGETHRLHIGLEAARASEALFQPSLIGIGQAGLPEVIAFVLNRFDNDTASKLALDVCLTGGIANLPGMKERVLRELREVRPFRSKISVRVVESPSLSTWYGAKELAMDSSFLASAFVTRQEYQEKGGEFLKIHQASNPYISSPVPLSFIETNTNPSEDIEIDIV